MAIDNFIVPNPRTLRTRREVDRILIKLSKFERKRGKEAVVALFQNKTLGGFYEITSREQAVDGIENPRKCEWYCEFWPKSYFEKLKEKLNGDSKRRYN